MNKEKIIKLLEDYEFFVDDNFGGHYEHINFSQRALMPSGIVSLLDYIDDRNDKITKLERALDEIEKYIKEYQEERTYTDRGGFTCIDGHFLRDSDYLLEIIQKAKGDVK